MFGEFRFVFLVAAGSIVALAVGFSFPALTESTSTGVVGEDAPATVVEESNYCENNLDGVDCRCFGQVSGYIRSESSRKIVGAYNMSKEDLARGQGQSKC